MNMLHWFYAAASLHFLYLLVTIITKWSPLKAMQTGISLSAFVCLYYFLWQFFTGTVNGFSNVGDALNDVWGVMFQMMQKIGRT